MQTWQSSLHLKSTFVNECKAKLTVWRGGFVDPVRSKVRRILRTLVNNLRDSIILELRNQKPLGENPELVKVVSCGISSNRVPKLLCVHPAHCQTKDNGEFEVIDGYVQVLALDESSVESNIEYWRVVACEISID